MPLTPKGSLPLMAQLRGGCSPAPHTERASVPPLLREERPMLRPATQVCLLDHGPLIRRGRGSSVRRPHD